MILYIVGKYLEVKEETNMIWIKFGSWCHKVGNLFIYDRVYTNSGKPTPIVVVRFRHVGAPPWDMAEQDIF